MLRSLWAVALGTSLLSSATFAQDVFFLPSPPNGNQVTVFGSNPFAVRTQAPAPADGQFVFRNPSGGRVYIIGRSGLVVVLDGRTFSEVARYSLSAQVEAAAMAPNGQSILVVAGSLRVIPLTADIPASVPRIDVGIVPNDVAVSPDSTRAYVTSPVSRTLTAVDLTTNTVSATQTFTSTPSGVGVAPNGLIYVVTSERVFEIDGRAGLALTIPGGITITGDPGRPYFSPDGTRLVLAGRTPGANDGIISVDLQNRTISTAAYPADVRFERVAVVSENLAYGVANGQLYQFGVAPAQGASPVSGLPNGILAVAASDEAPVSRYVFFHTESNAFRIDLLNSGQVSPPTPLTALAGSVAFAATPSTEAVSVLRNQTLDIGAAPGGISQPIIVRALDAAGRPVANVSVTFTTQSPGLQIQTATATTNSLGFAQTRAQMPAVQGTYVVRATAAQGGSVDISLRVTPESTTAQQFSIVAGNGQLINAGDLSQPFTVRVTDSLGNPVSGATVNWTIRAGIGVSLSAASSVTDVNGFASVTLGTGAFTPSANDLFRNVVIGAAVSTGSLVASADLNAVIYPNLATERPIVEISTTLDQSSGELLLPAGSILTNAFTIRVLSNLTGFTQVPIPGIGVRAITAESGSSLASCRANPVTNAAGIAQCDLVVGTNFGSATLTLVVGEQTTFNRQFPIRIIAGQPSRISVVQGDGQFGAPGTTTPQALVVAVVDAQGNPVREATISWTVINGDAQLVNPRFVTDSSGRASTQVRFGLTPGAVQVRATAGSLAANFNLVNSAPIGSFVIVRGNDQSASVNANFPIPLEVRLLSAANLPIAGAVVNYTVLNGPVTLSASQATTDQQGIALVTARAGSVVGTAAVRAIIGSQVLQFNLTVTPIGPRIDSILNGASFLPGVSRCSIAVIRGGNLASGLTGVLSAGNGVLPGLALSLGQVSVRIGGAAAPIYYLSNQSGVEQVAVQVPCEIPVGNAIVQVTVAGQTAERSVTLAEAAPGIFETRFGGGPNQGVAIRPNGTYVSPENPARHNEVITGYFTGLGPALQPIATNAPGIGQTLERRVIIGVNNQGMPIVSASYSPNLIGVYQVQFRIEPSVAGSGNAQAYAIAVVDGTGQTIFGQASTLPVQP